jgi:hypothetical protein
MRRGSTIFVRASQGISISRLNPDKSEIACERFDGEKRNCEKNPRMKEWKRLGNSLGNKK